MASKSRERSGIVDRTAPPVAKITVDGVEVYVDASTFTGRERSIMKRALAGLGYAPDGEDAMFASLWIVMRRTQPDLTFDEVLDTVTMADMATAEIVAADEDDSPEA